VPEAFRVTVSDLRARKRMARSIGLKWDSGNKNQEQRERHTAGRHDGQINVQETGEMGPY
jgi:hypothetical protein